ncbi:TPA: lysophospholipid acyltransferase family protein [Legionella anisa]
MLGLKRDFNFLPVTWVGWFVYFLMPAKRSIAQKNIERVFQESLSTDERKRIIVAYYSHIFRCIKEIFLLTFLSKKYLERRVKIVGVEHLHNALQKEKGALILTGHFGSWEFAPLFLLDKIKDEIHQVYCVRKSLRFGFLNSIFWGRFEKAGYKVISKENALSQIRSVLKNKNAVLFPFDLRPPCHSKSSLKVNFLGQSSSTYTSVACLTYRLNSPVLSLSCYRLNKRQHIVEFHPEIQHDVYEKRKEFYLENTKKYNKRLEDMVLAYPEQWLWSYKRW